MKKLLVVVDMQQDFVFGTLGSVQARAILPRVNARIKEARNGAVSLAYTMDTHQPDYLQTREGRNLPVPHCVKDTEGWALCPELSNTLEGAKAFYKPSFGSVDLGEYVRNEGFDQVELIGVCTGICVLSNAVLIKAHAPETEVIVDSALCACVSPESHQTALKAMELLQITVANVERHITIPT